MDTFLVRTLLVPSTVVLLGRWNWWPSKVTMDRPEPPGSAAEPPAAEPTSSAALPERP
jgi:putative drug exporter of the RND superfamily